MSKQSKINKTSSNQNTNSQNEEATKENSLEGSFTIHTPYWPLAKEHQEQKTSETDTANLYDLLKLKWNGPFPPDPVEFTKWFSLAVHKGDTQAQINLGVMHDTGRGVPQDDVEAEK